MLIKQWTRQDQLQALPNQPRFQRSRWSYWEPWVDLRLYQAKITGEERTKAKSRFQSQHRSIVEYLYRLYLPSKIVRLWQLDNPLMTEEGRSLQLKQYTTSTTTGTNREKPPRVLKGPAVRKFKDRPIRIKVVKEKPPPKKRGAKRKDKKDKVRRCFQCRRSNHTCCTMRFCDCRCYPERTRC